MRVAILINLAHPKNNEIARGAVRHGAPRGWEFSFFAANQQGLKQAVNWGARGLIASAARSDVAESLRQVGLPCVNVSAALADPGLPTVRVDDEAVGRLAAEHLLEQGLRRATVLTRPHADYNLRRSDGFTQRFAVEGELVPAPRGERWTAWLRRHQPVGCFATTASIAHQSLNCLRGSGEVPDKAALVSATDDELRCASATPAISAISMPGEVIGERAVSMLAARLRGRGPKNHMVLLPPLPVIVRGSSDVVACPDPRVAAALRYIRSDGCERIGVDDIVAVTGCSRRSLEQAFRATLGRTVHDALRRHRLARARELLLDEQLSVRAVAHAVGLQTAEHLGELFRRFEGCSPSAYRKQRVG